MTHQPEVCAFFHEVHERFVVTPALTFRYDSSSTAIVYVGVDPEPEAWLDRVWPRMGYRAGTRYHYRFDI